MTWILLVLFYGTVKGCREIIQKKALTKNSVMEILVFYTLLSFVFVLPQAKDAFGMEAKFYLFIAVKSFIIFLAWICSFNSLKRLPVSLYGILDMSGVLFATLLGVVFLGERPGALQIVGLVTVCAGLLLLKFKPRFLSRNGVNATMAAPTSEKTGLSGGQKQQEQAESDPKILRHVPKSKTAPNDTTPRPMHRHFVPRSQTGFYTALAIFSCLLNAVSGFLDKLFMKDVTTSQLQFWYLLFLCAYYVLYLVAGRVKATKPGKAAKDGATKEGAKANLAETAETSPAAAPSPLQTEKSPAKTAAESNMTADKAEHTTQSPAKPGISVIKNWWVWLLAVLFVVGDKALFMANGIPESSVSVMTLIKQSSCIITIIGGKLIFKEKDTGYRLFCAAVIIAGIVLGTISA